MILEKKLGTFEQFRMMQDNTFSEILNNMSNTKS